MLETLQSIPYLIEAIYAVIVLIAAYFINKIIVKVWIKKLAKKAKVSTKTFKPLRNMLSILVYIIALVFILKIFGMQGSLTGLLAGAGFAGIVVGFAAQDILSNFIGGIILFLDDKFSVGDVVEIGGVIGIVDNILMRTTTIKTWDGEIVIVPNSKAANDIIKNRSIEKPIIRMKLPIGVEYGTKINKVVKVCDKMMNKFDEIEKDPKPQVAFQEFANSSLNFELRYWINFSKVSPPDFQTKLSAALQEELEKAGIGIPFPHVEVLMKK